MGNVGPFPSRAMQWGAENVLSAIPFIWPRCLFGQQDLDISQCRIPQAHSRLELNAFLDLSRQSQPEEVFRLTVQFINRFPKFEFLGQVYRMQMKSLSEQQLMREAVIAGRRAVEFSPRDVEVLLNLASLLALYAPLISGSICGLRGGGTTCEESPGGNPLAQARQSLQRAAEFGPKRVSLEAIRLLSGMELCGSISYSK